MSYVELRELRKSFGERVAVEGLSFEISEGEIFGLLGPNGAGKTTTISMLAGVTKPSGGDALVGGTSITADPMLVRARLGYVPQDLALYEELSAEQNLRFIGRLQGLSGAALASAVDWVLEVAQLKERRAEPVARFSGGMKRRLNLAMGLIHKPALVILDEPTVGVDPQSRNHLFDAIRSLSVDHQMTVIYTSHYLEEVQSLCKRVAIVDAGRLLACGDVEELLVHEAAGIDVQVRGDAKAAATLLESFGSVEVRGQRLHLGPGVSMSEVLTCLEGAGAVVDGCWAEGRSLEGLFMRLTGRELRDR